MGLSYVNLTAILTKAIQEQQIMIEKQQAAIEQLESEIKALKLQG